MNSSPPFNEKDSALLRSTAAFLEKRLAEQRTIEWALRLTSAQRIERLAVEQVLNWSSTAIPEEPWGHAWRLIEESWTREPPSEHGMAAFAIEKRLRAGDRSGSVVLALVALVEPQLKVEPVDSWRWQILKRPKRPRTVDDLMSANLTSGVLVDLARLGVDKLSDVQFLTALASALEAAVNKGIDIGRRIGWENDGAFWRLGSLNRVYYTQLTRRSPDFEPDAHHRGIAPSVKLLWAIVSRIADVNPQTAVPFVRRWCLIESSVYTRLWAAMARRKDLVEASEVGEFLTKIQEQQFWDMGSFPEIAEVRALRFEEMSAAVQERIASRLLKGPPRSFWPKKIEAEKLQAFRLFWILRELQRITKSGGILPTRTASWFEGRIGKFPELKTMSLEEGFPEAAAAWAEPAIADERFDAIAGLGRLRALEATLSLPGKKGWEDPADRANDWIRVSGNSDLLLKDFETCSKQLDEFPRVWDRFGWAHQPSLSGAVRASADKLQSDAARVLVLLDTLSANTIRSAIGGISAWIDSWRSQAASLPLGREVWFRIWPIAVEATNSQKSESQEDLSVSGHATSDRGPMDLDTLNTPAGKLVGVFLEACPSIKPQAQPFMEDRSLRQMRDVAIGATGRSGLIVRHRFVESLPYFLAADRDWASEHLVVPLRRDGAGALALWRALARRTHYTDVLNIIGTEMAERAADVRLGRDTRRMLAFSVVVESLHAFRQGRTPAVPTARTQQMLRAIDDETRAAAANTIQQFIREVSTADHDKAGIISAGNLFRTAAAPFLEQVWPQEQSLVTPGVSRAFADLPAASHEAFAEAVSAIERFLVPFDCWSLAEYGLFGDEGSGESKVPKLNMINDRAKAKALLRLLDLTVGTSDRAVIPHDLTDALDQIRACAQALADSPEFRRLATAARR